MRRLIRQALLVAALAAAGLPMAMACSCFSPELREKTARETLAIALVAAYVRVVEVAGDGSAKVLVLESFKGPAVNAVVPVAAGTARCPEAAMRVGEELLLLSFAEAPTGCDKYAPDHFLVEALRANAAQGR